MGSSRMPVGVYLGAPMGPPPESQTGAPLHRLPDGGLFKPHSLRIMILDRDGARGGMRENTTESVCARIECSRQTVGLQHPLNPSPAGLRATHFAVHC